MLHCISTRIQIRFRQSFNAASHLGNCEACRKAVSPDIMTRNLLTGMRDKSEPPVPSHDFYTGIQRRIRLMQAEKLAANASSGGWEGVILQFQRVILSGAAAAALCVGLLAYAQTSPSNTNTGRESALESYISPSQGDRMLITRSEPISQDDVLFALVTEDTDNARQ